MAHLSRTESGDCVAITHYAPPARADNIAGAGTGHSRARTIPMSTATGTSRVPAPARHAPGSNGAAAEHHPLLHPLIKHVFEQDREYRRYGHSVTPDGLR